MNPRANNGRKAYYTKNKLDKMLTHYTVSRKKNDQYADEVDKRTKEFMELYKKRQRMAEHPFGTIKRGSGFTYFLTRGTENVRTETLMHFLIYNIKRVVNTMGVEKLIGELQG